MDKLHVQLNIVSSFPALMSGDRKAIDKALKEHKVKPAERKAFITHLRDLGFIRQSQVASWKWSGDDDEDEG
jgi:hypothetical protein